MNKRVREEEREVAREDEATRRKEEKRAGVSEEVLVVE